MRTEITTCREIWHDTSGELMGAVIERTSNGQKRVFQVMFADDPPERQEAVNFFLVQRSRSLFPAMNVPPEVESMDDDTAREWLAAHPIPRQWRSYSIYPEDPITRRGSRAIEAHSGA